MGIPQHYSRDLPDRCLHLIETLLPAARKVRMEGEEHLGPLTTTFLLAMSTPIITLPIERMERHRDKGALGLEGYADDRVLEPELARAIDIGLGGGLLSRSPFYNEGAWRFAEAPFVEGVNLARELPDELRAALASDNAVDQARRMPASQWASCLRNALAHGGIIYLNAEGYQSFGEPTEMIGFVSAHYSDKPTRSPDRLFALRITRNDYLDFLRRWVGWLRETRLSTSLAA